MCERAKCPIVEITPKKEFEMFLKVVSKCNLISKCSECEYYFFCNGVKVTPQNAIT